MLDRSSHISALCQAQETGREDARKTQMDPVVSGRFASYTLLQGIYLRGCVLHCVSQDTMSGVVALPQGAEVS